jgi:Protein of unknown function (DUF3800)
MTAAGKFHLYIDDTGSRDPDKAYATDAYDEGSMDCFGLGGVIIKEAEIDATIQAHKKFCAEQDITYPLHSHSIRRGRSKFAWLRTPEKEAVFMPALESYILSLPIVTVACIIDRPGYVARYKERFADRLWFMCKTAFTILVERAAKYVDEQGGAMEIYFEGSGQREDRDLIAYMRDLKARGMDFDKATSEDYRPLGSDDFQRLCLGKPYRKTKETPMIQLADLVLFPMAKGGYAQTYRPYAQLKAAGKLIDCHLREEEIPTRGIKYSCFDAERQKAQPSS